MFISPTTPNIADNENWISCVMVMTHWWWYDSWIRGGKYNGTANGTARRSSERIRLDDPAGIFAWTVADFPNELRYEMHIPRIEGYICTSQLSRSSELASTLQDEKAMKYETHICNLGTVLIEEKCKYACLEQWKSARWKTLSILKKYQILAYLQGTKCRVVGPVLRCY